MAIIKTVPTPFGVDAQYNRILKAEINAATQIVEVLVAIYASAAARDAGAPAMWNEYVRIPFSAFTNDPRNLLYPLLSMYGESYLKDGKPDLESTSGNYSIELKPEAMSAPVVIDPNELIVQQSQV